VSIDEPERTEEAICWLREGVGSGEGTGGCCADAEISVSCVGVGVGASVVDDAGEDTIGDAGAIDGVASG